MVRRSKAKTKPVSIRLTEAERLLLSNKAGNRPISVYMRDLALADVEALRAKRQTDCDPSEFRVLIAKVLGLLGKSQALTHLSDLARLAKLGALPVTDDTERSIEAACADIQQIKSLLMKALQIKER